MILGKTLSNLTGRDGLQKTAVTRYQKPVGVFGAVCLAAGMRCRILGLKWGFELSLKHTCQKIDCVHFRKHLHETAEPELDSTGHFVVSYRRLPAAHLI